jgi:hypothetical protein
LDVEIQKLADLIEKEAASHHNSLDWCTKGLQIWEFVVLFLLTFFSYITFQNVKNK